MENKCAVLKPLYRVYECSRNEYYFVRISSLIIKQMFYFPFQFFSQMAQAIIVLSKDSICIFLRSGLYSTTLDIARIWCHVYHCRFRDYNS
jgi:hypothetical protein